MKQVFFALKGSPIGFKLSQNKTDPNQLVIKARHAEVGGLVAQVAGCQILDSFKGSHYYLTFVDKTSFLANFGKVAEGVISGNVVLLPPVVAGQDVAIGPAIPSFNSFDDASKLDGDGEEDEEDESEDEENDEY